MATDEQAIRARLVELSEKIGGVDSDRERLRQDLAAIGEPVLGVPDRAALALGLEDVAAH